MTITTNRMNAKSYQSNNNNSNTRFEKQEEEVVEEEKKLELACDSPYK